MISADMIVINHWPLLLCDTLKEKADKKKASSDVICGKSICFVRKGKDISDPTTIPVC